MKAKALITDMEKMEQEEIPEVFEECENGFLTKEESVSEASTHKQSNNNHHVVYVGIIMVTLTIYLGITSVQKCLVSCVENNSIKELPTEKPRNSKILERLLEYKDICKDLEVFTKGMKHDNEENNSNDILKEIDNNNAVVVEQEQEYSSGSGGSGSGCAEATPNKHKKSKYSIKAGSAKNGFNKYNKSAKAKQLRNEKKDLNTNKKNSTAEPIIYLFALVFIYLLLKAASDINQHYKSQNKNDKRLRRCSLQSYAQTHRPDRRASKELALKQKLQQLQLRLKLLSHTSSQDQPTDHQKQQLFVDAAPEKDSGQMQEVATVSVTHPTISTYSSKWQLLRQHTTTHSLDNSDILTSTRRNTELSSSLMDRRCSVPAALSYKRQMFATTPSFSVSNEHGNFNVPVSRRTSATSSSIPLSMDSNESLITETKRRVRMINRH